MCAQTNRLLFGPDFYPESLQENWKVWFDRGLWTYEEAIRLACCGPKSCLKSCVQDFQDKKNGIRVDPEHYGNIDCFNEHYNHSSQLFLYYDLYTNEDWSSNSNNYKVFPQMIGPLDFIEWANSKSSITLPKKMIDWYYQQTGQRLNNQLNIERKKWEELLGKHLYPKEEIVVQVVLAKFDGKSHVEAYDEVIKTSATTSSKKNAILRIKKKAKEFMTSHPEEHLILPPWRSTP